MDTSKSECLFEANRKDSIKKEFCPPLAMKISYMDIQKRHNSQKNN